jgi:hypothetical protein
MRSLYIWTLFAKRNDKVSQTYNEAKDAVINAKTVLSRFVGTYDRVQTT